MDEEILCILDEEDIVITGDELIAILNQDWSWPHEHGGEG